MTLCILMFIIGFVFGASAVYLGLTLVKKTLLDIEPAIVTAADIKRWKDREDQIQILRTVARASLDKISGNV